MSFWGGKLHEREGAFSRESFHMWVLGETERCKAESPKIPIEEITFKDSDSSTYSILAQALADRMNTLAENRRDLDPKTASLILSEDTSAFLKDSKRKSCFTPSFPQLKKAAEALEDAVMIFVSKMPKRST